MSETDIARLVLAKVDDSQVVTLCRNAARTFSPTGQEAGLAHLFAETLGYPLEYLFISPKSPLVKLGVESVKKATGRNPKIVRYDWTTDGGILQRRAHIPTLVWGPCESLYTPLGPDEFITVGELIAATKSFAAAAAEICGRTKQDFNRIYNVSIT